MSESPAPPSPAAAREAVLRAAVARLRAANATLRERNQRLRERGERLQATNATLRERLQRLRTRNGELATGLRAARERVRAGVEGRIVLAATVRELRAANRSLRGAKAALTERLALVVSERRQDRDERKPAPLAHNTPAGMDRFYADPANLGRLEDELHHQLADARRRVLDSAGVELDGRHVADFGCGTGHALRRILADACPASVTGFDYAETGLAIARELLPEARFCRHDLNDPSAERFDLVLCGETLEHLPEPRRGLVNLLRAVAPGGVALVSVPDGRADVSRSHINFWSPESWPAFVAEAVAACAADGAEFVVTCGLIETPLARIAYNYALLCRVS